MRPLTRSVAQLDLDVTLENDNHLEACSYLGILLESVLLKYSNAD